MEVGVEDRRLGGPGGAGGDGEERRRYQRETDLAEGPLDHGPHYTPKGGRDGQSRPAHPGIARQATLMAFWAPGWPSIWISTFFGATATCAGMVTSSIPLAYFAVTRAGSTHSGRPSERSKAP